MKISDLIEQLEEIKKINGDLRITTYEPMGGGAMDYCGVMVREIRKKKKRERKIYYKNFLSDIPTETVLHV